MVLQGTLGARQAPKAHSQIVDPVVHWLFLFLLFITAGPIALLFAWGEGQCGGRALRYDEPRLVWASLAITH